MQTIQEMMQVAFDKAYIGVVKQGCASVNSEGSCVYRGQNNIKCGIGHIIPDNYYTDKFDSAPNTAVGALLINDVDFEQALIAGGIESPNEIIYFLGNIQTSHDNADASAIDENFLTNFKNRMTHLAKQNNLTIPKIV